MEFFKAENDSNAKFQNLIDLINTEKLDNRNDLYHFLRLISNISNNYHRSPDFFEKIQKIILFFKTKITQTFSNIEILLVFINNKLLLLFLFEKEIIKVDDLIVDKIIKTNNSYCYYFYPEFKTFFSDNEDEYFQTAFIMQSDFDEKRHIGENESYLCSLIRNDLVKEFISYVNREIIPLSSLIKKSVFETNKFIIENQPTLIEYATFYGSIQIFQYLKMNNVQLTPSLWLYAIHGNNPEIIHILEENKVELFDKKYDQIFIESIKCHHNDLAQYFYERIKENNNFKSHEKLDEYFIEIYLKYDNFDFFPSELDEKYIDLYVKFNYIEIVKILLDTKKLDINKSLI